MTLAFLTENMTSSELTAHMAYDCVLDENFMAEYKKRHEPKEEKRATAQSIRDMFGLLN